VLDTITKLIAQLVESAVSIVGIRTVEEPKYDSEPLGKHVEIRRYGPRIAAETVVDGDEVGARSAGFRRLAGYIFGKNRGSTKIDMTAPVTSSSTGPGWVIRFNMPASKTMESLPVPNDDRVRLVPLPAESVAVLRFSGVASPEAVAQRTDELREALKGYGFEPVGPPATWLYDPPWTLPFRRRNEVVIPITESNIVSNDRATDIPMS
jgi:hypothetical protein